MRVIENESTSSHPTLNTAANSLFAFDSPLAFLYASSSPSKMNRLSEDWNLYQIVESIPNSTVTNCLYVVLCHNTSSTNKVYRLSDQWNFTQI